MAGKTIKETAIGNLEQLKEDLMSWEKTGYFNQKRQLAHVSQCVAALLDFQIKALALSEDKEKLIVLPEGVKIE